MRNYAETCKEMLLNGPSQTLQKCSRFQLFSLLLPLHPFCDFFAMGYKDTFSDKSIVLNRWEKFFNLLILILWSLRSYAWCLINKTIQTTWKPNKHWFFVRYSSSLRRHDLSRMTIKQTVFFPKQKQNSLIVIWNVLFDQL